MGDFGDWSARARNTLPKGHRALLPQAGFQFKFLSTPADIAFGGGAAGSGKTHALLIENTRHRWHPNFSSITFRRTMPEIRNPGGIWDEANQIYSETLGGRPLGNPLTWYFPNPSGSGDGAKAVFTHLQHEQDKFNHKGGQYPLINFDELTSFTESQFWYLFSRNRTKIGVAPYIRATLNPQTSGWVKDMVSWYLYPDDYQDPSLAGYPIPERDGKLRWFARDGGLIFWGDSPREVIMQVPHLFKVQDGIPLRHKIKSFTFISGSVYENLALMRSNPGYIGNLMALGDDERNRLLYGCWKYIPGGNSLFDYDSLLDLWTNDFVAPGRGRGDHYLTADIAEEGSDLFVLAAWSGWRLLRVVVYEKSSGPTVINAIREMASRYQVPARNIIYDRDGVGGLVGGFVPGAVGFRSGGTPIKKRKADPRPNFENLKTQCAYGIAGKVGDAEMYIEPGAMEDRIREMFLAECRAHFKRDLDKGGVLKMSRKQEVKSRLKRSPDIFDAVIMRYYFELRKRRPSRTG